MLRYCATQTHILNCQHALQISAANLCPPKIFGVRHDAIPLAHYNVEIELDSPQPNFCFAWNESKAQNLCCKQLQDKVVCVGCMHVIALLHAPHSLFCKKLCNVRLLGWCPP